MVKFWNIISRKDRNLLPIRSCDYIKSYFNMSTIHIYHSVEPKFTTMLLFFHFIILAAYGERTCQHDGS